jgi:hypothetical protein
MHKFKNGATTCGSLALLVAPVLVGLISGRASGQELAERIDTYLQHRAGRPFSGVVVVAQNDSILFDRAYDFADADLSVATSVAPRVSHRLTDQTIHGDRRDATGRDRALVTHRSRVRVSDALSTGLAISDAAASTVAHVRNSGPLQRTSRGCGRLDPRLDVARCHPHR